MNLETLVLNRFGFAPRPGDVAAVTGRLSNWLAWQLAPPAGDDVKTISALAQQTLRIAYTRVADGVVVNELRPLNNLFSSQADLWALTNSKNFPDGAEQFRPSAEVRAASFVRATISDYQVREALTKFWHNHFSLNADDDAYVASSFPIYDRIMRNNALGNFRVLLGQMTKSVSMMYYLNQQSSTSAQPNENFAREVMELHTLGIGNYFGRSGSNPKGYTDDDVIALARVLTGWTIATGSITAADGTRPADGRFIFAPSFHDRGAKSLLGLSFDGSTGQAEGEAVLDRLAAHPGTAQFMALKLCRYFVADSPPDSLVQSVAASWLGSVNAPDQIAQAVRTIIYSPEFAASAGAKVKDPFQFLVSALRVTQVPWSVSTNWISLVNTMGYPLFLWPTPDGIPTDGATWTGTNGMLQRWNAAINLFSTTTYASNNVASYLPKPFPDALSLADYMARAYVPGGISDTSRAALRSMAGSSSLIGSWLPTASAADTQKRLGLLMAATISLPEFQVT
jgi:uncharacterized protein (DUF1800 family)